MEEYLSDSLARDSDDSKKMRQAENRVISKKNKRNHFKNKGYQFIRFRIGKYNNDVFQQIRTTPLLNPLHVKLDRKHTLLRQSTPFLHDTEKELWRH